MNKGVLILSGYNIRAVVAFCRWATAHQTPFHLIARSEVDPIFLTSFRSSVFLTRDSESLDAQDLCRWISSIRDQFSYGEVLILPSTEFLNRLMIHHRSAIESQGGIVPLVDGPLYERISDKYSFGQTCQDFGIAIPEEYPQFPKDMPFVAKPRSYSAIRKRQLKPYLIHSGADLARFQRDELQEDYYFQRYIQGRSIYLLAYAPAAGAPVLFAQENLMQQANGGSVILARTADFHKKPDATEYVGLLAQLKFYGLIMLEVRLESETQRAVMIEANPRLWGPIQLAVDNGIDLFGSLLRDHGFAVGHAAERLPQAPFYFWSGGLSGESRPVLHNYTADRFIGEFNAISRCDLFSREDTMALFRHELFGASARDQ